MSCSRVLECPRVCVSRCLRALTSARLRSAHILSHGSYCMQRERALAHAVKHTGVCEKTLLFLRAFALQRNSTNCSPAPDLVFSELVFPRVFFSGFHRRRYRCSLRSHAAAYTILYYTRPYYTLCYKLE